jgi:hypothetical protein
MAWWNTLLDTFGVMHDVVAVRKGHNAEVGYQIITNREKGDGR